MAKGLRASSRKKNNAALRAKVFGPASDARTERLSAKLQELAAKPRPDQERAMEVDEQEQTKQPPRATATNSEEMDIDAKGASTKPAKKDVRKKQRPGKIQKKIAKRKAKTSIVFADIRAKWRRQAEQQRKR